MAPAWRRPGLRRINPNATKSAMNRRPSAQVSENGQADPRSAYAARGMAAKRLRGRRSDAIARGEVAGEGERHVALGARRPLTRSAPAETGHCCHDRARPCPTAEGLFQSQRRGAPFAVCGGTVGFNPARDRSVSYPDTKEHHERPLQGWVAVTGALAGPYPLGPDHVDTRRRSCILVDGNHAKSDSRRPARGETEGR